MPSANFEAAMREIHAIARAREVALPDSSVEDDLAFIDGLPLDGTSSLQRDFEAGRRTEVEALALALPCRVEWHAGFRADADQLSRDTAYRGEAVAEFAASLAGNGILTPERIGEAARAGRHDPQMLKKAWHCLARFGNRNRP